jgi:hypothetical protein
MNYQKQPLPADCSAVGYGLSYSLILGKSNLLIRRELPNTAVSLITHPKAANAGVSIREFVKL